MARELWNLIPEPWREHLEICREDLSEISAYLQIANDNGEIVVPEWECIFAALTLAPEEIKVLVLGQDPYPNAEHAVGLAFAVPPGTSPLPGSLRNILKEVETDIGHSSLTSPDLSRWVAQGVLLLNTTLTTVHGASNSHVGLPWDRVVANILDVVLAVNPKVVAILWGKAAQSYAPKFASERVVMSTHPSPLSAHRGFLASKPFSKTNEMLGLDHKEGIAW
ncbi:MAG: uracil-DNA glycosylase [Actinomycetes bacterium]